MNEPQLSLPRTRNPKPKYSWMTDFLNVITKHGGVSNIHRREWIYHNLVTFFYHSLTDTINQNTKKEMWNYVVQKYEKEDKDQL